MRTPITLIAGHAEGLLRRGPQPPALQLIQQEAQRMGTLVTDLLDLARNDSGRLHLRRQPLQADDVLLELYERMAPQAAGRLRLQACAEAPTASGDPHRLQQCLTALVDNALLYSPAPSPGVPTRSARRSSGGSCAAAPAWPAPAAAVASASRWFVC